jgi:hypothetical protein
MKIKEEKEEKKLTMKITEKMKKLKIKTSLFLPFLLLRMCRMGDTRCSTFSVIYAGSLRSLSTVLFN